MLVKVYSTCVLKQAKDTQRPLEGKKKNSKKNCHSKDLEVMSFSMIKYKDCPKEQELYRNAAGELKIASSVLKFK